MSGITGEAAIEAHDLIHDAEVEEERMHPTEGNTTSTGGTTQDKTTDNTSKDDGSKSTMDKVKEALHMKK
ncbi:hypothetical protein K4F52_006545 [Lecanicillium sp. MT-2017a]|nr:hypothetical protein K4F52_006545 [Lecanicillium sp. MT-2017a]